MADAIVQTMSIKSKSKFFSVSAACLFPISATLAWVLMHNLLHVESTAVAISLLTISLLAGLYVLIPVFVGIAARIFASFSYVVAAVGGSWLLLVVFSCAFYGDCL